VTPAEPNTEGEEWPQLHQHLLLGAVGCARSQTEEVLLPAQRAPHDRTKGLRSPGRNGFSFRREANGDFWCQFPSRLLGL